MNDDERKQAEAEFEEAVRKAHLIVDGPTLEEILISVLAESW